MLIGEVGDVAAVVGEREGEDARGEVGEFAGGLFSLALVHSGTEAGARTDHAHLKNSILIGLVSYLKTVAVPIFKTSFLSFFQGVNLIVGLLSHQIRGQSSFFGPTLRQPTGPLIQRIGFHQDR